MGDYPSTMLFSLLFLSMVGSATAAAGKPTLVPNCTDDTGKFTETAVNCEDTLAATYCGIGAAKHFYLADATYLAAAKGGDATNRIIQCYSGADVTAGDATVDQAYITAAVANCPKTCGFCCMTPKYNCKNADEPAVKCETVTQAMCKDSKWRDTLAVSCPNKCGFCLDGGCVDSAVDCDKDPSICTRTTMATFAKANCKRTCGFCSNTTTTTGTGTCGDNHPNCKNWVTNGFCKSNGYTTVQKQQYCGNSCGLC